MMNKFKIFIFAFFLNISTLYSQDSVIIAEFNNSQLKNKLDSFKQSILIDSNRSEIFFFESNFMNENGDGGVAKISDNIIKYEKIFFDKKKGVMVQAINSKILDSFQTFLKNFFLTPNEFVKSSFFENKRFLSHDFVSYIFIKIDGVVFYDKLFLHSMILGTENKNFRKLLMILRTIPLLPHPGARMRRG